MSVRKSIQDVTDRIAAHVVGDPAQLVQRRPVSVEERQRRRLVPRLQQRRRIVRSQPEAGDQVRVDGCTVHRGDEVVAKGTEQTPESVETALTEAKAGLSSQLEAFVEKLE